MLAKVRKLSRTRFVVHVLSNINLIPIVLPVALAAFGAVAIFFLLIGQLRDVYVWPLGLLVAGLATGVVLRFYPKEHHDIEYHLCNLLTLGGVLLWGGFNLLYTAQHLITNRDPGTYTNASIWLVHHVSLHITATNVFGAVPGVLPTSPGVSFSQNGSTLLAQGQHLLPVFLGLIGRIVGVSHMLHLNVVFGVTALLAIYGFARLIIRPFWAMTATGVLAASMPFIYFSRDTYTEPLAATFTFGALSLLWLALRSKKISLWFLAGLVAGAGTLTRIDGYLTIACMLVFLIVMLVTAPKAERTASVRQGIALCCGMTLVAILGWLDVSVLSTFYYLSTISQFHQELAAIIAVIIFGAVIVWAAWRTSLRHQIDKMTRAWRPAACALFVVAVAIILASRPLWYRGYDASSTGGAPIRNFAELTTEWVSWYIGPVLAVLGVGGLALATATIVKRRNMLLTAAILVVGGTALVYLIKPSIAPDQIWASRRLVPVILPGIAVFGGMMLDWIAKEYIKRLQWGWVYAIFAAFALVLAPAITSRPLLLDHDTRFLSPVNSVCAALPNHAAVLWIGIARSHFVQATDGVCGVPSEGYGQLFIGTDSPSKVQLAQAAHDAENNGHVPIIGMYGSDVQLLPPAEQSSLVTVSTFSTEQLNSSLTHAPDGTTITTKTIVMGCILPDGTIMPFAKH